MQTKRARLYGALLLGLVAGAVAISTVPATASVGVSPTLEVAPAACDLLGATDILVTAGALVPGETYLVMVDVASTGSPFDARNITGNDSTVRLVFADLPNGQSYGVTISNAANTLSATTTVTLPTCDLPTLPDEPHAEGVPDALPDDLAHTGASAIFPAVGGIGLIQFGLVLIGIAVLPRRFRDSTGFRDGTGLRDSTGASRAE